jgi:hypothetical protein
MSLEFLKCNKALLKIDTQGSELDVLIGAGELLREFVAVEIELPLSAFYKGSATIDSIIGFLGENGFQPLTLQTLRWNRDNHLTNKAIDCDGLFINHVTLMNRQSTNS